MGRLCFPVGSSYIWVPDELFNFHVGNLSVQELYGNKMKKSCLVLYLQPDSSENCGLLASEKCTFFGTECLLKTVTEEQRINNK